jgi:hypothetical protein
VSRVRLFSSGSAQARRGRGIADLRAGDFKVAFGLLGESQEACECPVVGQVQLERPSGAGAHSVPFARRLSRRQAKLGFDFHESPESPMPTTPALGFQVMSTQHDERATATRRPPEPARTSLRSRLAFVADQTSTPLMAAAIRLLTISGKAWTSQPPTPPTASPIYSHPSSTRSLSQSRAAHVLLPLVPLSLAGGG